MGPLGMGEVIFLLLIGLLLFGPGKLPELGRLVGRGLAEFRRASNDLRSTIEGEIRSYENKINTEAGTSRETPKKAPPAPESKSSAETPAREA